MHDDRKSPTREMSWIVPPFHLDRLGFVSVLPMSRRGIRVAAVGADESIDQQLQGARRLIPVHRRHDHYAVRGDEARVELVHPVIYLPQAVIRIARTRP